MRKKVKYLSVLLGITLLFSLFVACKSDIAEESVSDSTTQEVSGDGDSQNTDNVESIGDGEQSDDGDGEQSDDGDGEQSDDGEGETGDERPENLTTIDATVMSFNIRYRNDEGNIASRQWVNRKQAVCEFVLNSGAEIIGFQEVKEDQYRDLKGGLSDKYEVIWYASYNGSDPAGNAFAYDRDIWAVVGTPNHFWLSDTPEIQSNGWGTSHYRSCINVLLEHIQTGVRVEVFVTHLDHKSTEAQTKGADLLLSKIEHSEYPTILCGDFNVVRDSAAYKQVAAAMLDAQLNAIDSDTGTTYNAWGSKSDAENYVIDYCFFSKKNTVVKSFEICKDKWGESNSNYLSDHNAIKATAEISAEAFKYPDISNLEGTDLVESGDRYTNNY